MVKRLFQRDASPRAGGDAASTPSAARVLVEESREIVVVLDEEGRVVAASRRARERFDRPLRGRAAAGRRSRRASFAVAYDVGEAPGDARLPRATPATWPRTRSFAPASPPRSRTSSARRSRACSPCSRRRRSRTPTRTS